MSNSLKIISWNIAGARKINSSTRFDYSRREDIAYFAEQIRSFAPDVVCLQEVHASESFSVAKELAVLLGFLYVHEDMLSPSHIDDRYQLGMAVLSRVPLAHRETITFPRPDFPLFFKDGRPAAYHNKAVQLFEYDGLTIANTQLLPLDVFGENYDVGSGQRVAKAIDTVFTGNIHAPFVFCGDFNFNTPHTVFPDFFAATNAVDALPDVVTRPDSGTTKYVPDHIYFAGPECVQNEVKETETDHYLCFAEFRY